MKKLSLLATSVAIALTGCGGSDDDSKQPVETGRITITAMDGYIQNALICADENNNGTCEVTEVITDLNDELLLTDEHGQINASISLTDQDRLAKHTRLIATAQSVFPDLDIQTVDNDLPSVAMKAVTLRAPAGSEIISPITDLVVAKADTGLSKEEAEHAVLESLSGLSGDEDLTTELLYSDYIEAKDSEDESSALLAKKIHKTAQILTETKANASSDEAFDKAVGEIVTSTVNEVETISEGDLNNSAYKPYVPVTDEGTTEIVTNTLAHFDAEEIGKLNTLLGEADHYGDVSRWQDISIAFEMTSLVKDDDTTASTITVANEKSLADKNLTVTITDAGLTVTRSDSTKAVSKGQYDIILATTDINSDGDAVKGTVKAADALKLNVKSYNNAPEASENGTVAQDIQTQLSYLTLEKYVEMAQTTIDFNGLFSDEDGDALSYSAEVTLPGLTAEVSGTNVILSGTPKASLESAVLTITAQEADTEEKYSASVDFILPKAAAVTQTSELKDILVNSSEPWYRWNGDTEYTQEITTDGVINVLTGAQNCMGMKFIEDGTDKGYVLFAEGKECPSPEQITEQDGTWRVGNNGEVIWSFDDISEEDDDVAITLSGLIDNTHDVNQPRIVSFELETQAMMTYNAARQRVLSVEETGRGVTFYQGFDAAQHYWNFNEGYAWVANQEIRVDLTAVHGQFTEYEQGKHIDVDMYFNNISCEELGFKQDTDNSRYIVDDLRAEDFTIYSEGFGGQVIQFGEESWYETPYAFAGQDDDGSQYCAVNLEVSTELGLNTQAGQSLTVHYSPKDSNTDEEFIVNTFIDRDMEIQPEANLVIDEQGIYFVDELSVSHFYKDSDGIIREAQAFYSGEWSDWGDIDENQTITQYTACNGNFAYQFWYQGYSANENESFTIWSYADGELMFKDTGSDDDSESSGVYFIDLEDAKKTVESNAEPMVFTGTTWLSSNGDTMSFTQDSVSYNSETMLRTELPGDYIGCMVDEEANICFVGTAIATAFCDDGTNSGSWANCAGEDQYTIGWHFDSAYEFKRVKISNLYGQVSEETWARQY